MSDIMSGMEELPEIGPRIRELRSAREWTLDTLAHESAVSRSMLSEIERGDANPTFATLWKITSALGVEISDLIEVAQDPPAHTPIEITTSTMTPKMSSPDGKVTIRALSPIRTADSFEWYELVFAPGGVLASAAHAARTVEHLTAISGDLEVEVGGSIEKVEMGATARYRSDITHAIRNTHAKKESRALLVMMGAQQ